MRRLLNILLILGVLLPAGARTRTTQKGLHADAVPLERLVPVDSDSVAIAGVNPYDITMSGYTKRASDTKETFLVTNNTDRRISALHITLRYTSMDGYMLHERQVVVPVTLKAGETQLVSISAWDRQRMFYYHAGPRPRKAATPYNVAYRLTGYDIPIGY